MKVAEFPFPTKCLDIFDAKLQQFNKLSDNAMPLSLAIGFLKTVTNGSPNTNLLHAWVSCEIIT